MIYQQSSFELTAPGHLHVNTVRAKKTLNVER